MRTRTHLAAKAFSLVESVLAVGVVAFAFVGLVGLLPCGLDMFRKSMDISLAAQISQRVFDDLQQSEFDTVVKDAGMDASRSTMAQAGYLPHRFFDDQGNEVRLQLDAGAEPTPQQRFAAHILYDVHTQIEWKGLIPGADNQGETSVQSPSLCSVTVQIINNPGGLTLPEVVSSPRDAGPGAARQPVVSFVQQTGLFAKTGTEHPPVVASSN
jgi:uncharacterized protein (TIGR02598 family)